MAVRRPGVGLSGARVWWRGHAAIVHKWLTLVWVGLMIPSLTVWKDSLTWVIAMSVWANIAGHWGAYQAARTDSEESA